MNRYLPPRSFRRALVISAVLGSWLPQLGATTLWIEGESAVSKKVRENPWYGAVRKDGLSGGAWVYSFAETATEPSEATWNFDVPKGGKYQLWLRIGSGGTGYTVQLDGGAATAFDMKEVKKQASAKGKDKPEPILRDERNVALDGLTDARFLSWLHALDVDLTAGKHTLRVVLGGEVGDKRFGGVDVICVTDEPFTPNGQFKPGEKNPNEVALDEKVMWTFTPKQDELSPSAVFDLRYLNEKVAGEKGFVRLSKDGMSFLRGDGQPIRFWGGTDYNQRDLDIDKLKEHAQFLAKRGVNIVRWHGHLPAETKRGEKSNLTDINEKELDQAFKLVAGMKTAGIYTALSPYWGSHTNIGDGWNLPNPGTGNLSGLVFFVPEVQAAYKGWLKELYTRKNPYTGIPLKDDPAVAIIQLQNEDSMLFWTMQGVKGEAAKLLRGQFVQWLTKKYGSLEKAREHWKNYAYKGDDWENKLPELFMTWDLTRDAMKEKGEQPGFRERRADSLQFIGETMYAFNKEIVRYLREDLGCKQLVNAGNWRSADPVVMDDVERWSYTPTEVLAKNHYFDCLHTGRTRGWQILPDNIHTDVSATRDPRTLPTNIRQAMGHPFFIGESLWVPPNRYESEGPMIVASQQALNGVDIFLWFGDGVPQWSQAVERGSLPKWSYATPMQLGQFPAAALLFRAGYVKEGTPAVIERRSLDMLWSGTLPLTAEGAAFDPNRDAGIMAADTKLTSSVDPLAFLTGPVLVEYGGNPAETKVADTSSLIDAAKKKVRSNTGEIEIAYGTGLYTINAPCAQAAIGFLGTNGDVTLGDVQIRCKNDHASIAVVSLDGKPIKESKKVLVQVGTFQRPKGWLEEKVKVTVKEQTMDAFRILSIGTPEWLIRNVEAQLSVRNPGLKKATLLDENGMRGAAVPCLSGQGALNLTLPPNTLYLVLEP